MEIHLQLDPAVDDLATTLALVTLLAALAARADEQAARDLETSIRYRLRRMTKVAAS
jgi:hypothetical protein